jgi:hypothetical protein
MENTGVLEPIILDTDYIAGESPLTWEDLKCDWSLYLPLDETQRKYAFDTFACVTFSALNELEKQFNRWLRLKLLPQTHYDFLKKKGYLDENGLINFSDRWIAKKSNTGYINTDTNGGDNRGNTQNKVAQTIRDFGLIPETKWAFDVKNVKEYYKEPPVELDALGQEFNKYFDIRYEWVILKGKTTNVFEVMAFHLKHAPIQITAPVCPFWKSGNVPACPLQVPTHATCVYKTDEKYHILDHYEPYKKTLDKDYPVLWGMKIVPFVKTLSVEEQKKSIMLKIIELYKQLLAKYKPA